MELQSAMRIIHSFLTGGDAPMRVHMIRPKEEYLGYPKGVFLKGKTNCVKPDQPGDKGNAAIGHMPSKNGAMRKHQDAHPPLSWDAREFVLAFQIQEQGKDVIIYLDVNEIVGFSS